MLVVGQAASAFAPNYTVLLALRLAMLAVAAIYTPQAASTAALIVSEKERPGVIAFVFLGWSLAVAGGLPLVTFVAAHFGWRAVFGVAAAIAVIPCVLLGLTLPHGLRGKPLSLESFGVIGAPPPDPAAAAHHGLADLRPVHRVRLSLAAAAVAVRSGAADHRQYACDFHGVAGFAGDVIAT